MLRLQLMLQLAHQPLTDILLLQNTILIELALGIVWLHDTVSQTFLTDYIHEL